MKTSTKLAAAPQRFYVPLASVRPDPDQPRKHFDGDKLKELAASIEQQGIICDLIVSYQPAVRVAGPDLVDKAWRATEEGTGRVLVTGAKAEVEGFAKGKEDGWYQILEGERRWRAAQLAGLKEIPVVVREVDAKMRLSLQVIANQQREALTAIEEAAAYQKELDSKRHTIESLYKSLGVSRGTLFSRLVLNRLHPPVRAALETGKISVSVAGLVAMVPEVAAQKELVESLTDESDYRYPWSVRDVQEYIEEEYCKALKGAPFDIKREYSGEFKNPDKSVTMLHLRGACDKCRFRSGNIEGAGTKNPNVCTDPRCFAAKTAAAWAERKLKAEASGQRTIDAAQWAKVKGQYIQEDKQEYLGSDYRAWGAAMGKHGKTLPRTLAQTPDGIMEVIARSDAKEAATKNGVKFHSEGSGYDWQAQQAKRQAKIKLAKQAAAKARPLLVEKVKKLTSLEAWRLVARAVCQEERVSEKRLKDASEAELRQLVLETQYCNREADYAGDFDEDLEFLAKQCGVDLEGFLTIAKNEAKAAQKKSATPPRKLKRK